jgi:hypothetical protein
MRACKDEVGRCRQNQERRSIHGRRLCAWSYLKIRASKLVGDCITNSSAIAVFLAGGGEMGELVRAYDWTSTPLEPDARWPQGLKTDELLSGARKVEEP